jgi:hypothetical protein
MTKTKLVFARKWIRRYNKICHTKHGGHFVQKSKSKPTPKKKDEDNKIYIL